jgi:hypothetical protein
MPSESEPPPRLIFFKHVCGSAAPNVPEARVLADSKLARVANRSIGGRGSRGDTGHLPKTLGTAMG